MFVFRLRFVMALIFLVQGNTVKPLMVESGMVIKGDTPAFQMDRHALDRLNKAELQAILEAGYHGGRLTVSRDKKQEFVDYVANSWDNIVTAVANRHCTVTNEEDNKESCVESEGVEEGEKDDAVETAEEEHQLEDDPIVEPEEFKDKKAVEPEEFKDKKAVEPEEFKDSDSDTLKSEGSDFEPREFYGPVGATVNVKVYRDRCFWKPDSPEYVPMEIAMDRQTATVQDIMHAIFTAKGMTSDEFHLVHDGKKCATYRRVVEYAGADAQVNFRVVPKLCGGAKGIKKDAKNKQKKMQELKDTADTKAKQVDTKLLKYVPNFDEFEAKFKKFSGDVEANPIQAFDVIIATMDVQDIDKALVALSAPNGSTEYKLMKCCPCMFGLDMLTEMSENIDKVFQTANSILVYGVMKMNEDNPKNGLSGLKLKLERAKFHKLGAQSASAKRDSDVPM